MLFAPYFRCCSLSCDLAFFLYSCASYKFLCERWDDILIEYHKTFTTYLSELGSDPALLTLEELKADMKESALLGVGMAMEALPFQMMDDSETPDLDSIEVN